MSPGARRLLRPAWLLSHLLVIGLVVVTANLGFWQLHRLDARRTYNAVVTARADHPVVSLAEAFGVLKRGGTPEDLRHVRVVVSGTWADGQVYLANRSMDGVPGVHVVSLLWINGVQSGAGAGVVVDRGFVHRGLFLEGDSAAWAPATADVEFVGSLDVSRNGERGSGLEVDRIDLEALSERWGTSLAPMWIRASGDGTSGIPVAAPVVDLGAGSHLSYAVQWFVFTLIGLGGYPLVLFRLARRDPALA